MTLRLASPSMLPARLALLVVGCVSLLAPHALAQAAGDVAGTSAAAGVSDAAMPPPPPPATPAAQPPEPVSEDWDDGFRFGTCGSVGIAWDGRGGTAQPFSVVAHGPRLAQPAYLELDLGSSLPPSAEVVLRILTPLAVFAELFHFTADPLQALAIRNLYVESTWKDWLALWAGSRMYRGDDVYLFDWWPLDNLNTVGGGLSVAFDAYRIAAQVGMNRLDDEWQTQWFESPDPIHGTRSSLTLDRPRTLVSLKAERLTLPDGPDDLGWKVALYGEGHFISAGALIHPDRTEESLPDDQGWVAGVQGGLWTDEGDFLNLWVRTAGGLAAYGEWPFLRESTRTSAPWAPPSSRWSPPETSRSATSSDCSAAATPAGSATPIATPTTWTTRGRWRSPCARTST